MRVGYDDTCLEEWVLSDAVAGASDLKRDKALSRMKSRGAHVMTCQELLNNSSCVVR